MEKPTFSDDGRMCNTVSPGELKELTVKLTSPTRKACAAALYPGCAPEYRSFGLIERPVWMCVSTPVGVAGSLVVGIGRVMALSWVMALAVACGLTPTVKLLAAFQRVTVAGGDGWLVP